MNKNFVTAVFTIILMFFCVIIALIFEKYQLVLIDTKVSDLDREYKKTLSETDSIKYEINSALALEKLTKIAKTKNFFKPEENRIVIIDK